MNNTNKVTIKNNIVKKQYITTERFLSEQKNIEIFNKKSFEVPKIINIDATSNIINFEYIPGKVKEHLNTEELNKCIDYISEIHSKFSKKADIQITNTYIKNLENNIIKYAKLNNFSINPSILKKELEYLKKSFITSVFKDTKPTNWIFNNDINNSLSIKAIDFDYVVDSYFLANISQLLNYHTNISFNEKLNYLDKFLINIRINKKEYKNLITKEKLFKLAMINSMLSALEHNKNMKHTTIKTFNLKVYNYLKDLLII